MNVLSRDQQITIVSALTEGMSIRAIERMTGVHRDTIMRLGARVGAGCAALHDRTMNSIRANRLELDETWSFVGKKQKNVNLREQPVKGDQYLYVGMASTSKAIIAYRVGKRNSENTAEFLYDLRERVLGQPEISTDGFHAYRNAIRDAFGARAQHGVINKTYSVTHLVKEAQGRYSPAAVVSVEREVVSGDMTEISTSYVERQNLTLRMSNRRFTRLSNGFSKKLDHHCAAVSLYVAHFNLCRVHEAHRTTPAVACGVADHVWSLGELIDAALANVPDNLGRRRKPVQLTVIEGGKQD